MPFGLGIAGLNGGQRACLWGEGGGDEGEDEEKTEHHAECQSCHLVTMK